MSIEMTERQAFIVLNALPNIGPITLNRLLDELGLTQRDAEGFIKLNALRLRLAARQNRK